LDVRFFFQPFQIGDGPHRCGDHLLQLLNRGDNAEFEERFILSVAFVKRSGMRHLMVPLTALRERGGRIEAYIGTNRLGDTTREAIRAVCDVAHDVRAIRILGRTFHPKVFVHERRTHDGGDATLLIGSNNLNSHALFTNVEEFVRIDLDLDSPEDHAWYTDFLARIETPFTGEHEHNDRLVGRGNVEQPELNTGVIWFLKEEDVVNQAEHDFILSISRSEQQSIASNTASAGTAAGGVVNPSGGLATEQQIPDTEFDMNQFNDDEPEVEEPDVDEPEVGEADAPPLQPPEPPQIEIPQVVLNGEPVDLMQLLLGSNSVRVYEVEDEPPDEIPIALWAQVRNSWIPAQYGGHATTQMYIPRRAWAAYLPRSVNYPQDMHTLNILWQVGEQNIALNGRYGRANVGNWRLTPGAAVSNSYTINDFALLVPLQPGGVANALFSDHEWLEYDAIGYIISQEQYPEIHQILTAQIEEGARNYGHLRMPEDA
jgi:HKD family nuclease